MTKVFVQNSELDGQGVFALRHFAPGETIGWFTGGKVDKVTNKYCLAFCRFGRYEIIEGHAPFRYLNDASMSGLVPNAEIHFNGAVVATDHIKPGSEILINYNKHIISCSH